MRTCFHKILFAFIVFAGSNAWIQARPWSPPADQTLVPFEPNDPDWPSMWNYFSALPADFRGQLAESERGLGSGMHVDQAWQLHQGTPETLIAVLDSGVNWETEDIRDRVWLNTGELPLPEGSKTYDANHDGRVSVSDYEHDSRVKDFNNNGMLDVGDLIEAFSDHIDQDGNGFVDDISGWDFHEHDNNPADRIRFGHGTGEAKDSAGALNNGRNGAGACGQCSVVFLRVNDSFVTDANAFAAAVIYGTNLGAAVIQEALGSLNHNAATQAAVNYAWQHDTVVIGSAADENSYHHNYPATLDPVVYVNALRFDSREIKDATSFVAFNNCSNLGARVDVAASGTSCSSEATGQLSGITALAASYARSLGAPLKAGELISLIKTTATDINLGSNENQKDRYSTWRGWDRVTGYGRVHAYNMLQAIAAGHIPPTARIVSPKWFELLRRGTRTTLPVTIETGVPRSGKLSVRLDVTRGVDTAQSTWLLVKDSGPSTQALDGRFADLALDELDKLPANLLDGPEYRNAFTLRLTVDNLEGQTAEARRTLFLFDSKELMTGFPVDMGASGESSGLFADLNGDGAQEYITVDGAGRLHAFTADAKELPGFPTQATAHTAYQTASSGGQKLDVGAAPFAAIAAGDLDQDGKIEVVVSSMEGDVSVIQSDGSLAQGSPFRLPFPDMSRANPAQVIGPGIYAAPVLADLDGDGRLDIIVVGADGFIYAFAKDGHPKAGYPVAVTVQGVAAKLLSSPAVYDLNGDGIPDLVLGSNHTGRGAGTVLAIDGRGNRAPRIVLPGFPVQIPLIRDSLLPTIGTGIPTAPLIADLNHDGRKEILIHGFAGKAYVISLEGVLQRSFSLTLPAGMPLKDDSMITGFGHPSVADLSGQGILSPVMLGVGSRMLVSIALGGKRVEYDHLLGAWNGATGLMQPGFPRRIEDLPLMPTAVSADLTGDGKDEIVVGSGGYFIHAFTETGEIPGFPEFTGGWMLGSPSIGDIDGDGRLEVAGTTREGYVLIWKTNGPAGRAMSWPTFKGNNQRTGVAGVKP